MSYTYYCAPYDSIHHGYRCFKIDNNADSMDFELGFIDANNKYNCILTPQNKVAINLDQICYFNYWPDNIILLAFSLTILYGHNTGQLNVDNMLQFFI